MIKKKNDNETTKPEQKESNLPSVLAHVTLMIEIMTGPKNANVPTIDNVEKLVEDPELFEKTCQAIGECPEVQETLRFLYEAAYIYKEDHPKARVLISPALAIKEPEEVI